MAFNFRSAFQFLGKAAKFVPGVGTTISQAIELVAPGKEKPDERDMLSAVRLVEKIRSIKPGVATTEFAVLAGIQGICATILFDPSMPNGLRIMALACQTAAAIGYMVSRAMSKKKMEEKS